MYVSLSGAAMERKNRLWFGLEPWKAFNNDANIVKKSSAKQAKKFFFAAFRCLYFYTRCATKLRLRAARVICLPKALDLRTLNTEHVIDPAWDDESYPSEIPRYHSHPID